MGDAHTWRATGQSLQIWNQLRICLDEQHVLESHGTVKINFGTSVCPHMDDASCHNAIARQVSSEVDGALEWRAPEVAPEEPSQIDQWLPLVGPLVSLDTKCAVQTPTQLSNNRFRFLGVRIGHRESSTKSNRLKARVPRQKASGLQPNSHRNHCERVRAAYTINVHVSPATAITLKRPLRHEMRLFRYTHPESVRVYHRIRVSPMGESGGHCCAPESVFRAREALCDGCSEQVLTLA